MKIYMSYHSDTLQFNGFYLEGIHDEIPIPNICINEDLWSSLRELTTAFKLTKDFSQKEIYTLEDRDLFEIIPFKYEKPKPTKTDLLEEQNAYLIKENLKKDIQIKDLNMNLAQTTLNSINKDIEIKNLNANMAQTTLNLVNKDIQIKGIEKDVANLILKSLGGKHNG